MKIHVDLPWGGVLHFEKKPMEFELKLALGAAVFFICFILAAGLVMR